MVGLVEHVLINQHHPQSAAPHSTGYYTQPPSRRILEWTEYIIFSTVIYEIYKKKKKRKKQRASWK
jgi:hypothetical protein